ncbi:class I adenylate-forming enzyme family protein [Streptomyces caatingaensis]|uniref:Uncharacterized protein n=1 Tax=Streptomyces caatingaensis TaxID=1678637 RepID=A0A0K9XAW6_9ACTN|nr:class I adenylate-forming enzyme family protein [Streptomyces caatingaensis]KNB50559.1 hypothetical protein AC230_21700 [Streptomyces caatingaensis]
MSRRHHDLTPRALRDRWTALGLYPGKDVFTAFTEQARRAPDRTAVADEDGNTTYATLLTRSLNLAGTLRKAGVRQGDVVAVNLPNGWRACAADLAVAALGAVVLPYPVGRKRRETLSLLRRSGARAAIVTRRVGGTDYAALVDELRPELPALEAVFVHDGAPPGTLPLDEALTGGAPPGELPEVDPGGPARIMASSGSEAEPKLVLYSHDALVGGQTPYLTELGDDGAGNPPRFLFCVPLSSPFGSFGTPCTLAAMGATLVTVDRFDPAATVAAVRAHRPSHVFLSPAILERLLTADGADRETFAPVRAIVCGGAHVHAETIRRCEETFGVVFVHSYGSADGICCHTALDDDFATKTDTAGRPDPRVVEVRVADEADEALPAGAPGEIHARGPMSPLCYLGAPELDGRYRTADGWVRTGDLGFLDADGRLHITGRKKDVINRGGYKISVAELEEALHQHPDVRSAAVLGAPDERLGERVLACVVLRDAAGGLDLAGLCRHLRDRAGLDSGKLPERLAVLPEFPLTPAGKVDKRALRSLVLP